MEWAAQVMATRMVLPFWPLRATGPVRSLGRAAYRAPSVMFAWITARHLLKGDVAFACGGRYVQMAVHDGFDREPDEP